MGGLVEVVREEVEKYAVRSLNTTLYPTFDELRQIYSVLSVRKSAELQPAQVVIMARVEGEYVIIETDTTDTPPYEALEQRGIPRDKIILAYAGEKLPL